MMFYHIYYNKNTYISMCIDADYFFIVILMDKIKNKIGRAHV